MRKSMIVLASLVPVLTILAAAPTAAQDVIYHFEGGPGPADAQGNVFTLPLPPPLPPPPPGAGAMIQQQVGLLAVEPFDMAQPITGAPYTADISSDVVQQLADGNRIEHHTTSSIARDGQGRVRREQQLTAIGPILPQVDGRIITIMDPVAKVSYSLDPVRKVAIRMAFPGIRALPWKRAEAGGRGAVAGGAVTTATATSTATATTTAATTTTTGTFFYQSGSMVSGPATATGTANNVQAESLGTSQIEGVPAQGTRTVITIKAGAIGNQAPIEMVTEQWYSSELGAIVLSKRSDPRFGETTYRLQNIVRAEPSAELFRVPADYTIESGPPVPPLGFVPVTAAP